MNIENIVIVGGGSSGWMTAAAIAYMCPEINLTLIESSTIPNIGVGESTLGHINKFFQMLDMKDKEWMPSCNATYKNSIQFSDFYKKNTKFQYPFGDYYHISAKDHNEVEDHTVKSIHEWFALQALFPDEIPFEDFSRYWNFNSILAEHNRQTDLNIEGLDFATHVAYHLDADALGVYLKKRFCKNVIHILDDVSEIKCDEEGITEIISNNHKLTSDLFIDCTGFKSMLLENTLGVEFEEFPYLINDSAVNARIPYINDDQTLITNVTDCRALSSGWLWNIPLWHRRGQGYVYSSKFLNQEQAEKEFRQETTWNGDVNHLKFRHGVHKKAWHKNVLAIGLSYGFIEPLESTGLLTVHENIVKLITILKKHNNYVNNIDKQMFNKSADKQILALSSFVSIHYALSRRADSDYWKYVTENITYDEKDIDDLSSILSFNTFDHTNIGMTFILAGMRINPVNKDLLFVTYERQKKLLSTKKDIMLKHIDRRKHLLDDFNLPTSYQYLKTHIYD
jgi:tryptophan halogenase